MSFSGTSQKAIKVLVADSNQTQSQLLASALRRQPAMTVQCCRSTFSDCMEILQADGADVVVVSDDPSDHDRLTGLLRGLHSHHPSLRPILSLDSYDRGLVLGAMRAGARGLFCRATQPFRALCRCIVKVHEGQYWLSVDQIGYLVEALSLNLPPRVVSADGAGLLTAREEQVASLTAEGIGNREISQQLGIKENTVKKSLWRIYGKLGLSNRVELVLYVLTHRGIENRNNGMQDKNPALRTFLRAPPGRALS